MATAEIPVRLELASAWTVSPGDKLIVGFSRTLNLAQVDTILARFRLMLPDVEVVIVDGITHMAVYRQSDDTAATAALRHIWEHLEQSDESFSAARLRRIIVEAGTFKDEDAG